jgi:hypothetical protein
LGKGKKIAPGEHSDRIASKDKAGLLVKERKKSEVGYYRSGI